MFIKIFPQNTYNYFVEICFGRVTHYYLRLAESYLEEREAELGQSIKQKPTGEISTQEVHEIF